MKAFLKRTFKGPILGVICGWKNWLQRKKKIWFRTFDSNHCELSCKYTTTDRIFLYTSFIKLNPLEIHIAIVRNVFDFCAPLKPTASNLYLHNWPPIYVHKFYEIESVGDYIQQLCGLYLIFESLNPGKLYTQNQGPHKQDLPL